MIRLDISSIPEGCSHEDLEEDSSELDITLEGGRLASPLTASLDITRNGDEIFLTGRASVKVVFECARCLEEYTCVLQSPVELVVVLKDDAGEEGACEGQENLMQVPNGSKYADLTDEIRSELLVRMPIKPLCRDTCKGLCPECGANLNPEKCSCKQVSADSRWNALNSLKKDQH
ncbi:MAG: DUF177 domain-containing protein [Candidatus Eisenbacteria bacterium]